MNREYGNGPKPEFSNEFLNAFLDNQLTLEEKERAYLRISQDEALNRRVCELRKSRMPCGCPTRTRRFHRRVRRRPAATAVLG